MKEVQKLSNSKLYIELRDVLKVGSKATLKAKLENKNHGIPKIFVRNGIVYFELENGQITTDRPEALKRKTA